MYFAVNQGNGSGIIRHVSSRGMLQEIRLQTSVIIVISRFLVMLPFRRLMTLQDMVEIGQ